MTELSPYWIGVLDKLHGLGVLLTVLGGIISLSSTIIMVAAFDDPSYEGNIFATKKWLLLWIIPFIGILLVIFCPEIIDD